MRYIGYILVVVFSMCFYCTLGDSEGVLSDIEYTIDEKTSLDRAHSVFSEEGMLTLPPQVPATYRLRHSIAYRVISTFKRIVISYSRQRLIALSTTDLTTDLNVTEYSQTVDKKAVHRPCDYYIYGLEKIIC